MASKSDRLALAREQRGGSHGLTCERMCELLGVARTSAYYEPEPPKEPTEEETAWKEERMAVIDELHIELPASGARKMARECAKRGLPTTRHQAARLMEEMNVVPCYPRPNTSKAAKHHPTIPYLIGDKSKIKAPMQVWSIDITYIRLGRTHMYLTAIIDWFSKRIMGWELSDTLEEAPVIACVRDAVSGHGAPQILNSDMGVHFTANEYMDLMAELGIRQSMDGKGRWVDNRAIERWWRTLKTEWLRINEYETPRELRECIAEFVGKYNGVRPHQSLDYATPDEYFAAHLPTAA